MIFLEEVARKIASKGAKLDNLCVVCPNIRTIDYLKHYLAKILKETVWSPKFMNLSELTQSFTEFSKADELVLMIELYKSFMEVFEKSNFFSDYNFDKFYGIGEIILKDFNEIDNYLVDVEKIFVNIADFESINYIEEYLTEEQVETIREFFGHFSTENISEEKEYFIELWSNIPKLYDNFNKRLTEKKIGYNGLIAKDLCSKIEKEEVKFDEYEKYLFVGFNALTKAQKVFLKAVQDSKKAEFYWDYDNFYVDDKENEAGLFVRQDLEIFSDDLEIDRNRLLKDKDIKLIGFPLEISQTKALPTILNDMGIDLTNTKELAKTAVVMPDDNLLFPVLHALPSEIEQVNVTLGFPFRYTSIYNFVSHWLEILHKFIRKNNVFYEDLVKFFDNQILIEILGKSHEYIVDKLKNQKELYFDISSLKNLENTYTNIIFDERNIENVDILLENILKILEIIFFKIGKLDRKIETEAIFQFYRQMLNIQTLFSNELAVDKELISSRIIIRFLKNQLSGVHIPFQGKSLDGLQLMTIMETRNLDFENLIILNMNEQILPKKASHSSLISEFMRKSFGMPVLMYQDSIFAFLFYSLIQNAKNVVLTYSNLISDKGGEISRFVQQLNFETDLIKSHQQYSEQIKPKRPNFFEVEKDDEIIEKLNVYLNSEKLLSASALNSYITCSMKFYFQRIAKIEPPKEEENEFEIDALKFGNIFHNSMEKLYTPFIGKNVEKADFVNIRQKIYNTISETIYEILGQVEEAAKDGLNGIVAKVIKKHIEKFLDFDEQYAPFTILSLENSKLYNGFFDINVSGKIYKIKLLGIFDRVDEKAGHVRIIDYKTGSDDLKITKLDDLFDTETAKNSKKAIFQMLLYSLIYKQNHQTFYFEPYLLKTRELSETTTGRITVGKKMIDSNSFEVFEHYEENLISLLEEIFDKNINFAQTSNIEACKYCDYVGICGR